MFLFFINLLHIYRCKYRKLERSTLIAIVNQWKNHILYARLNSRSCIMKSDTIEIFQITNQLDPISFTFIRLKVCLKSQLQHDAHILTLYTISNYNSAIAEKIAPTEKKNIYHSTLNPEPMQMKWKTNLSRALEMRREKKRNKLEEKRVRTKQSVQKVVQPL